jgi:DNA repair photolyase
MNYKHVKYGSLLNKITNKDLLFIGDYTLDPYQNCEFGCKYCDSSLDETIYIKTNAVQLLEEEIGKIEKGIIIVGSVHDPYQEIEKECRIARSLLEIIKEHDFPCHILTKSNLILRDIDILSKISKCLVTVSITTLDENTCNIFEENVPSSKERLQVVEKLSEGGIKTGLAIMPILPFIVEEELEKIVEDASKHKADYILHKHLELKGDQKTVFLKALEKFNPSLINRYKELYKDSYMPSQTYILNVKDTLDRLCTNYKVKNRI